MNFAIQKEVLVQCLKEVSSALAGRTVQPILNHICTFKQIDESSEYLFKATDLDLLNESTGRCSNVYTPGSMASARQKTSWKLSQNYPTSLFLSKQIKTHFETAIQCGRNKNFSWLV